ncbi:MAG: GGDEF domain-containing protein, partial [Candidatus Eremiobacteraeota bacterium]|nr:GGDEF domain-containing protein [Candidatus Eremiobacteraeota bacterium]
MTSVAVVALLFAHAAAPRSTVVLALALGAVVIAQTMSGFILLAQFVRTGTAWLALLAAGYFLPGFFAVAYAATFPGMVASGTHAQTAAYVWVAWHTAFPALVLAAIAVRHRTPAIIVRRTRAAAVVTVAACAAAVGAVTLPLLAADGVLPPLVDGERYTAAATAVATPAMLALAAVTLALLARRSANRNTLAVWVSVALVASMLDAALGLECDRFSYGWYAGKLFMVLASTIMLAAFIGEVVRLQARLMRANEELELSHQRERRAVQQHLVHLSTHDELTGLYTRARIEERLRQAVSSSQRDGSSFAVLFASFDAFREINEAYGRASGDDTILEAAVRIRHALPRSAWVGRFGGDEFVIVLAGESTAAHAERAAQRVHQALRLPFAIGERRIGLASSIGIARFPDDGASADALIDAANAAAHRAKRDGGNTIRFFSREFAEEARSRRALHDDLVAALTREEFFLEYQPIVDLV